MATITWRNVNGPSLGESSDILTAAGNSFNAGLGTLDKMLKQREAVQLANQEAVVKNNSNAFMADVDAIEDPVKLAAMKGQFTEQLKGYNGQVDPNLRNYMDTRTGVLNTRLDQERVRTDAELTRAEAPIIEAYRVAGLNKDEATQAAIQKANPNIRNWSTHIAADQDLEARQKQAADANTLNGYRMTTAELQAQELKRATDAGTEDRAIQSDAIAYSDVIGQQKQQVGLTLGKIAASKGYPVNAAGMVDVNLLDTAQRADMTLESKKLGIDFGTYGTGDTKAFTNYIASLKQSGKYSPAAIDRNLATIQGRFNTAKTGSAIGDDANNAAVVQARQDVLDNEDRTTNWHAPGSANAMNTYETVAKEIPMLIDSTTGFGTEEDVGPLQSFLHEMATVGIDIGDGEMVTPSVNDLRAVIRSAEGGWFKDSTRATNAKEALIKIMKTTSAKDKIKKAEDIKIRDRNRAAKAILNKE